MWWGAGLSRLPLLDDALAEAADGALRTAGAPSDGPGPDVAIVFASSHHFPSYTRLVGLLRRRHPSLTAVIGTSGYGVVGPPAATAGAVAFPFGPGAVSAADIGIGAVSSGVDGGDMRGVASTEGAWPSEGRVAAEELEDECGVSVALGHLPGVTLGAFHFLPHRLPDGDAPPAAWHDLLRVPPGGDPAAAAPAHEADAAAPSAVPPAPAGDAPSFVLLCDSAFSGIRDLLAGLDYAYPSSPKVGGLASSSQDGRRALFAWAADWPVQAATAARRPDAPLVASAMMDGPDGPALRPPPASIGAVSFPPPTHSDIFRGGVVGLSLRGPIEIQPIVAQGCRAIGSTWRVVKAQNNIVLELERAGPGPDGTGGRSSRRTAPMSAIEALQSELRELNSADLKLAQASLMCALASAFKAPAELARDDFLCRGLLGVDQAAGGVAVGERVRVGQYLRWMVRSQDTAAEDLRERCLGAKRSELAGALAGSPVPAPLGALIFACTGRGRGLYGAPHVDARIIEEYVRAPLCGYFANGEIGPVEAATHLHGFTSVVALLRPRAAPVAAAPAAGAASGAAAAAGDGQGPATPTSDVP